MDILTIIKLILTILAFTATVAVPCVIALRNAIKKRKAALEALRVAQTEAEKAAAEAEIASAESDMLNVMNEFIIGAEKLYGNSKGILASQGVSSGALKKDNVMTKLHSYAIEKGYSFDAEKWSEKIDKTVDMTKQVNGKLA